MTGEIRLHNRYEFQTDMTSYDVISVLDQQECIDNDLVIFHGYRDDLELFQLTQLT